MAERRSSIGKTWRLGAAAAAVAIVVAGVYVTLDPQGNGAGDAACAATAVRAAALDPLIGGEVAAFIPAGTSERLSELAFDGTDETPTTLAAYEGKVALVNLWATWCAPCRKEMPSLDRLQAALGGEDFAVVPISVDTNGRDRSAQFLESIAVENLPLLSDQSAKIFDDLKVRGLAVGLPVTVLLDRNGCRLGHINGPAEWDSEDGMRLIEAAIGLEERPQG